MSSGGTQKSAKKWIERRKQILFQEQYFRLRHKIVIGHLNSEGGCMASFKQKMAGKAVLFAYDHKQISKRGKRLGDSYKEVKKTIENIGKDKTR